MVSVSKNVCNNKLDDVVNENNNKYHRTVKMESVDVQSRAFIDIMWSWWSCQNIEI